MPIELPREDDSLRTLVGVSIPSAADRGVRFHLERVLGGGAMSVVFFALRQAPDGQSPVVVKVHRPDFVRTSGADAHKVFCKETVALGRLNERVPPTPFVVRLIDTGSLRVEQGRASIELPWLALEYVHGGDAGTTLADRVAQALRATQMAFEPRRALRAIDCLTLGLTAVHQVGVIHRDLKPENILCCGFGEDEILKVSDFGVARPQGITATFGGGVLGTPGYAAPEQLIDPSRGQVGPATDVFSLAALVYFVLTGEDYFPARSVGDALAKIMVAERRSVLESSWLSPELRMREVACRAIDAALAQATAPGPEQRPQSASALAASIVPWLKIESWRSGVSIRSAQSARALQSGPSAPQATWSWILRQQESDRLVRSVAWDSDGTCLAATSRGLAYWDGRSWRDAPARGLPNPRAIRFVRRVGPARWLVACDPATFAIYTPTGLSDIAQHSLEWVQIEVLDGQLDDLALAAGRTAQGMVLLALSGRRWLKALPLPGVEAVNALARLDDARWLVAGRSTDGSGYLATYAPLEWDLEPLAVPVRRELRACGASMALQLGAAGGAQGTLVWVEAGRAAVEHREERFEVTAVAIDPGGGGWAAGAGRVVMREVAGERARWVTVWQDSPSSPPVVSLFADVGYVVGMTADGSVVEGRREQLARA
jgi:serine/threonine protein kinase